LSIYHTYLVTSLTALLCLTTFTNIVSSGAFPAVLPDIARSAGLADWQLGIVAGAFGFARMVADIPLGLCLTRHLRRALWIGPLVLVTGGLCVTAGGGFTTIVLGRLLMGVGQALSMVAGLTAILRFQAGGNLASALAAYELSAMIGMLGGAALIGTLPSQLTWNTAFLLACAPQLIAVGLAPKLVSTLPAQAGAAAPSYAPSTPSTAPANPHARPAGRPSLVPLVFAAGGLVALTYSTMEQFVVPLRGSREFGLERDGVARLFMVQQIFDIAALIPTGMLADRQGPARVLPGILLLMATANALIGFGALPVVVAGCALFGLSMSGWMLPLTLLRRDTEPERIAWRTGLYRVCVDGGIFLGPFLSGILGMRLAGLLPALATAGLAVTALLLLARARSSGTMTVHG
jgi:predicted MFS family arabinose efflux permease